MKRLGDMVSKIIFLGTAGDSFVYGRQVRNSGGIVIKTGNYQFFIDPGPGALLRAKTCGVNPRETIAVVATHCHVNHASDLNAIIGAMSYNGMDRLGVVIANKSVVEGSENNIQILSEFHKSCIEKVIVLKEGQKVGIENMEIRALKALHDDPNAIGLKIFTPDFVLCCTGDTRYNKELLEQYKQCDILIANTVHASGEKSENNLSSDDVIKIIRAVKPQLAVITHFGKSMLKADPMMEARRIQKETGVQVIAATDGMVLSPNYYSAEMKQKRLNLYTSSGEDEEEKVTEEEKETKGPAEDESDEDIQSHEEEDEIKDEQSLLLQDEKNEEKENNQEKLE